MQSNKGHSLSRALTVAALGVLLVGAIVVARAFDPAGHEPAPGAAESEYEAAAAPPAPPPDETPPPEDEPFVERPIDLFTHFPMDFAEAFDEPSIDVVPITPFFIPIYNGTEKWYLQHPHYHTVYDEEFMTVRSDWPVYLVADATLDLEQVKIWVDRDGNHRNGHAENLTNTPVEMLAVEPGPDGDEVILGIQLSFIVDEHVRVSYEKQRVRKAIVDEVIAQGGEAHFPAGTHIGYGANALLTSKLRPDGFFRQANPLDFFVPDKRTELLELYAPLYEMLVEQGNRPFTDLADSRLSWDIQGTIFGMWRNMDLADPGFDHDAGYWSRLMLVDFEHVTTETYWRVLEHPWNVDNGLVGLMMDNDVLHRLYLVEGDTADGVLLAIREVDWEQPVWDPVRPDGPDNHPSIGRRQYLRVALATADDLWDETLTLEKFADEQAARSGFTDAAVVYERGFHIRD